MPDRNEHRDTSNCHLASLRFVDLDDEKVKAHIDRGQQPSRLLPIQKRYNSFDLEDLMNDRMFESPVFVKDGNNHIQEIAGLEDAVEFLYEWPRNRRGPIYDTALRACQKAFDSDYSVLRIPTLRE